MSSYKYHPMFPLKKPSLSWRLLTREGIKTLSIDGKNYLKIDRSVLTTLAEIAFHDISHYMRSSHLEQLRTILEDPQASTNDRFVARELLINADIASEGILPMCQDTGTAIIMGKKGQYVLTDFNEEDALSEGAFKTWQNNNLRYSQTAALDMFKETNTGNNLPAQIDLLATSGDHYEFLFMAKGGGSANKTYLYQETKALLNPETLKNFLSEKLRLIGTSACPPYHLAIVIGGTSAETTLKTVKLASARYLDTLPSEGNAYGQAFRDKNMEEIILKMCQDFGIGAQLGGKYFCHDVRVIRLPRHGASCPVGIGVSCSADRQVLAKITSEGAFIEQLETEPQKYLPTIQTEEKKPIPVNLNQPMKTILSTLSSYPVKTLLSLTGTLIVARDIAHAKLKECLDQGEKLPDYFCNHPIYYAGPAKTPDGYPSGSFGPTTAGRMDSYVDLFQAHGGSMIMLAKGNRSDQVTKACHKYGGFYLASIGGPAARLARDCIKKIECIAYHELGMEAIWKIEVENFPAMIIVDDKGHDFFKEILKPS